MYSRPLLNTFWGTRSQKKQTDSVRKWNQLVPPFWMCTLSHILTQLIVLLPQGSVVTSLQAAPAFRTASHTCCSHNEWSAKLTELQKYSQALQLCCWGSYAQGLLVWWRHLTSSIHQSRGCLTQDQLQAANPTQHSKTQTHSSCWSDFFTSSGSQLKKKSQWAIQLLWS